MRCFTTAVGSSSSRAQRVAELRALADGQVRDEQWAQVRQELLSAVITLFVVVHISFHLCVT